VTKSASAPLPASVLEALARYDTPTICNAMEIVAPERRLIGYTTKPLVCPFQRATRARPWAISAISISSGEGSSRSSRRPDNIRCQTRVEATADGFFAVILL